MSKYSKKEKPNKKRPEVEETYEELHKFKPEVFIEQPSLRERHVRIKHGKKEALMHQTYEKNQNVKVLVEFDNNETKYFDSINSVYEAELEINKYLKGK